MTTTPRVEEIVEKLRKTKTFPQQLYCHDGKVKSFDRLSDSDIHYNRALDDVLAILTNLEDEVRREEREKIKQKMREINLIDYYCDCNNQGHVIAMARKEYDSFIEFLNH